MCMSFIALGSLVGLIVGILFLIFGKEKKILKIFGWLFTLGFGLLVLFFVLLMITGPM